MTSFEDIRTLAKAGENEKALEMLELMPLDQLVDQNQISWYLIKADLLYTSLELKQALFNYQKCLNLLSQNTDPEKEWNLIYQEAVLFDKIGQCHINLRQIKDGIQAFSNALKYLEALGTKGNQDFTEYKIQLHLKIAEGFKINNKTFFWRKHLTKALDLIKSLENYTQQKINLASAYASLAESYETEDFEYAIMYWKKSADLYKDLSENDESYTAYLAACFNNIAVNEKRSFEYEKAVLSYSKAFDLYLQLYISNPLEYKPFVAAIHNSLGILFSEMFDKDEALNHYLNAHEMYSELAAEYPDLFLPYFATAKHNIAVFFDENQRYDEALKYYEEALTIRKNLAASNPDLFKADSLISGINLLTMLQSLLERSADVVYLKKANQLIEEIQNELGYVNRHQTLMDGVLAELEYLKAYFNQVSIEELEWIKLINESIETEERISNIEDDSEKLNTLLKHLEHMDAKVSNPAVSEEFRWRSADAFVFGSWQLLIAKEFDLAEKYVIKSLQIKPLNIAAQVNNAHINYIIGKKDKAVELYRNAISRETIKKYLLEQLKNDFLQLSLFGFEVPKLKELTLSTV